LVTASVVGVAVPGSTAAMAGAPTTVTATTARDATDRIIVKFRDRALGRASVLGADTVGALSQRAGMPLAHFRAMSGDAQVLALPVRLPLAEVEALARRLAADPAVEYAEPDVRMFIALVPNDTQYNSQWHYKESSVEIGGANLPAAWDITTGSASIVVAVIDTGLRPHADIDSNILDGTGRVVPGYDFIVADGPSGACPGNACTANDGGGRDADPSDPGDWITTEEDAGTAASGFFLDCGSSPSSWHGTHVAGTIGALSNNGSGVAGVNWNTKILPVRVLGKCGGYSSDIIDGARWAAGLPVTGVPANANPAKVLNLSLGGGGTCSISEQTAINEITAAGAVVVVAAGNSNVDASLVSPANCNGVITVAASDRSANKASYSNYGSVVKITAPGGSSGNGVLSTVNSGTTTPGSDAYASYQGTSMAAPHVSGVAALVVGRNGALSPAQTSAIIQGSARVFPVGSSCTTSTCGSGLLDAAAAVRLADPALAAPTISTITPNSVSAGGGAFELTVDGSNFVDGGSKVHWNGSARSTTFVSTTRLQASILATDVAVGAAVPVTVVSGHLASGSTTLNVNNPVPAVSALNPTAVIAGGGNFTLTVTGANFVSGSTVRWNGSDRSTTYVSGTTLTATILASDIQSAGTASVTVFNPTPAGGESSVQSLAISTGSLGGGGGCFIATAAYGTPMASDVRYLRAFRDQYLLTNAIGRGFVKAYYTVSPPLADFLRDNALLRGWVRLWLKPWVDLSQLLVSDEAYQAQTADRS
jgi:serine protease